MSFHLSYLMGRTIVPGYNPLFNQRLLRITIQHNYSTIPNCYYQESP